MQEFRFGYTKTGSSKYISHLYLMATMQRSFIRAGIGLKYSEGFNPHPYMSVALPLSVGYESICELIDVAVLESFTPDIEKIELPEGIEIIDAYIPESRFNDITWLEIYGKFHYSEQVSEELLAKIKQHLSRDSLIILKRTKRGTKDLDIAPFIKDFDIKLEDCISFKAKISAQNPTINADDLINALDAHQKPDHFDFKRIEIYDADMIIFK